MNFVLDNGKQIRALMVNFNYRVDSKRTGAGVAVCEDRITHDGEPLYVTWVVYPSRDNENIWWAESGHYGMPWDEALDDMKERFSRFQSNHLGDELRKIETI